MCFKKYISIPILINLTNLFFCLQISTHKILNLYLIIVFFKSHILNCEKITSGLLQTGSAKHFYLKFSQVSPLLRSTLFIPLMSFISRHRPRFKMFENGKWEFVYIYKYFPQIFFILHL